MQDYFGAISILFAMFLLVAAATEAIIELFRGVLERFGITALKSNVSLDDAIQLATEYLPDGSQTLGKVAALSEIVGRAPKAVAAKQREIEDVREALAALPAGAIINNALMTQVNVVAMHIRDAFDADERRRVFALRLIAVLIATLLSSFSGIDALRAMVQAYPGIFTGLMDFYNVSGQAPHAVATPNGLVGQYAGVLLTGIAAASGSSYWHDALDKVRNMKNVSDRLKKVL